MWVITTALYFQLIVPMHFFFLIMTDAKELLCVYNVQWTGSCSRSKQPLYISLCQCVRIFQFELQMILNLILSLFLSSAIGISFLYGDNVVFIKDGFKNFAYFCVFNMEWARDCWNFRYWQLAGPFLVQSCS